MDITFAYAVKYFYIYVYTFSTINVIHVQRTPDCSFAGALKKQGRRCLRPVFLMCLFQHISCTPVPNDRCTAICEPQLCIFTWLCLDPNFGVSRYTVAFRLYLVIIV
jgi:hypothetical protein